MPSPGCRGKHTSVYRVMFTVVDNHYAIFAPSNFLLPPSPFPLSSLSFPYPPSFYISLPFYLPPFLSPSLSISLPFSLLSLSLNTHTVAHRWSDQSPIRLLLTANNHLGNPLLFPKYPGENDQSERYSFPPIRSVSLTSMILI